MSDHEPLMASYQRLPVAFERGSGVWLWDRQGTRYLDALSGIAVCGLGHAHPEIARALCDQASRLVHTSNLYEIPIQRELAAALTSLSGMTQVFFCNSGAEANEAAIKLVRLYARSRGIAAPVILIASGSFHGRTMATLSATANRKVQDGFEPLLAGFREVPYDDLKCFESIDREGVVAIMIEPVQGEGGIVVPAPGYLCGLRELCDANGWLLVADEIQTGLGRTGRWFACQHEAVLPDLMTLAKSLGNGVPIGACLAGTKVAPLMRPGKHGSTFGGNPLACRAALAVLDVLGRERLDARAATLGARMLDAFRSRLRGLDIVVDIRGKGLMLGLELAQSCGVLVERALERGLLINVTAERVVRLLPPMVTTDEEADLIVNGTAALIEEFAREAQAAEGR
jgi:acetylornithine aminotransferase